LAQKMRVAGRLSCLFHFKQTRNVALWHL
jgi:hypothetical protein